MKRMKVLVCFLLLASAVSLYAEDGKAIFDGKTLNGWDGDPKLWSVQDGAITGKTTIIKQNTFLIWKGGELKDFELRLKYRIENGNSGVQFRSRITNPDRWVVGGYQADMEAGDNYSGILYEEKGRGILAQRGQKVRIEADGKKTVIGSVGDSDAIQAQIKKKDWNDYVIIAKGNHIIQKINGLTTVEVIDDQEDKRSMSGVLAFQVHVGPPMTVQFKDIVLKELDASGAMSP